MNDYDSIMKLDPLNRFLSTNLNLEWQAIHSSSITVDVLLSDFCSTLSSNEVRNLFNWVELVKSKSEQKIMVDGFWVDDYRLQTEIAVRFHTLFYWNLEWSSFMNFVTQEIFYKTKTRSYQNEKKNDIENSRDKFPPKNSSRLLITGP